MEMEPNQKPSEGGNKPNPTGKIALIILIAIFIVAGVSCLPLQKWTGGRIKDFNLLGDILPLSEDSSFIQQGADIVDPELLRIRQQSESEAAVNQHADLYGMEKEPEGGWTPSDTVRPYVDPDTIVQQPKQNRVGNLVAIEDYTTGGRGLRALKAAIAAGRLGRIAVVGDSYIEGDIFTQNLREQLQEAYGGEGVGYMSLYSDFPGFRRSVKQGGSGWHTYDPNKKAKNIYLGLAEHYYVPTGNAIATYKGSTALKHVEQWSKSQFLFIAPDNTVISTKSGEGDWTDHQIQGSERVQCLTIDGTTSDFQLKTSDTSLIGLGVWLDGTSGIAVDCMSSRGFSGVTLLRVNAALCRAMAKVINYDLIILEFGINAMTSSQTDYSLYSRKMVEVINHVRTCYPTADILVMGIGDRGEKRGAEVHSMKSAPYMVAAQREAARKAHCLFWDTREAMGGNDAIVAWAKAGKANKDYIHMTHQGGAELATLLFNALRLELK